MNRARLLLHDWLLSLADWVEPKWKPQWEVDPANFPKVVEDHLLDELRPENPTAAFRRFTDFDWDNENNWGERL